MKAAALKICARRRHVLVAEVAASLQHRQRTAEAGVELHRQRDRVQQHRQRQDHHAAEHLDDQYVRRLGQRHDDRRRQHHDGADSLHLDRLLGEARARLQRRIADRVLHGVARLVRGDDHGRQRSAVEVLRQQPDDLGFGVVVVAEFGLLHLDVAELHLVQDVAGELAAGAGKICALRGVALDHPLDPHLRQHGEADDQTEYDQGRKQSRAPIVESATIM